MGKGTVCVVEAFERGGRSGIPGLQVGGFEAGAGQEGCWKGGETG